MQLVCMIGEVHCLLFVLLRNNLMKLSKFVSKLGPFTVMM